MASTYKSKYTGEEIDELLGKASTAVQPDNMTTAIQTALEILNNVPLDLLKKLSVVDGVLCYDNKKLLTEDNIPTPEAPETSE